MRVERHVIAELKRNLAARDRVRLPAGADLLWRWFADISMSRGYNQAGPNPLQFSEIAAYSKVSGWPIEPRHVRVLMAMDVVFLEHAYADQRAGRDGVKILPRQSGHAMSTGLFDAMFG